MCCIRSLSDKVNKAVRFHSSTVILVARLVAFIKKILTAVLSMKMFNEHCSMKTNCAFVVVDFFSPVLRARVWSDARDATPTADDEYSYKYPDRVYTLKIVEIFKGKKKLNKLPGADVSINVRSGPGLLIDLHTPNKHISNSFLLQQGKVYLLSAYIYRNKLRSSFCGMRVKWTHVTCQQRAGLNGQYSKSC